MILNNFGFKFLGTKDHLRVLFWMPKLLLNLIHLWPVDDNPFFSRIFIFIPTTTCTLIGIGLMIRVVMDSNDFDKTIENMRSMTTIAETILKIFSIYYHTKSIKLILDDIMEKSWPYDLLGADDDMTKSLRELNKNVMRMMATLLFCAYLYALLCCFTPVVADEKMLPFPAYYPFDHLVFPTYLLMYIFHVISLFYIMVPGVIGFDLLLLAICSSIVGQYKILQKGFAIFNTEKMYQVNRNLRIVLKDGLEDKYEIKKEYLVRCIRHHQYLMKLLNKTNRVFSFLEMVHLVISALSICIGLVLTNQANTTTSQYLTATYFTGCILFQLFLYCAIGNEVHYQASLLPQYIFQSKWHTLSDTRLKKDVMFILMRAQQDQELTSYQIIRMDLLLVVRVVRLSFSGYTFLSTMNNELKKMEEN